jgi:hypothetical protein
MRDAVPATQLLERLGLIMPQGDDIVIHWKRMWEQNPYFKIFNEPPHFGWVMEYEGEIVGYFGNFPRSYYLNGEPFRLVIPSQWGVVKEFRPYINMLCHKFFNENHIHTKLVTTAILPTGKIFERYNSRRIPSFRLMEVYMIPFKIDRLLMMKIGSRLKHPLLVKLTGYFFKLITLPWRLQYYFISKNKFISEIKVSEIPSGFDAFWQKYLKASKGILASRNADNLKWFYQGGFRNLENKLFVYQENNEVMGYISIINEPVKDSSLNRYKVVDMIAISDKVKNQLMKYVIRYCFDKGAELMEIHLPGLIVRNDIPVFTLKRYVSVWPFYYHTDDPEIDKILQQEDHWHTSPYDGDVCLF